MKTLEGMLEEMKEELLKKAQINITFSLRRRQRKNLVRVIIVVYFSLLVVIFFDGMSGSIKEWGLIAMFGVILIGLLLALAFYNKLDWLFPKIKISDEQLSDEYKKIVAKELVEIASRNSKIPDEIVALQKEYKDKEIELRRELLELISKYEVISKLHETILNTDNSSHS